MEMRVESSLEPAKTITLVSFVLLSTVTAVALLALLTQPPSWSGAWAYITHEGNPLFWSCGILWSVSLGLLAAAKASQLMTRSGQKTSLVPLGKKEEIQEEPIKEGSILGASQTLASTLIAKLATNEAEKETALANLKLVIKEIRNLSPLLTKQQGLKTPAPVTDGKIISLSGYSKEDVQKVQDSLHPLLVYLAQDQKNQKPAAGTQRIAHLLAALLPLALPTSKNGLLLSSGDWMLKMVLGLIWKRFGLTQEAQNHAVKTTLEVIHTFVPLLKKAATMAFLEELCSPEGSATKLTKKLEALSAKEDASTEELVAAIENFRTLLA